MGWGKVRSRDLLKVANAELQELRGQAERSGARAERAEAEAREAREARRGELEAARAESFGTFQELQRAREAAEARATQAEAHAGPLEARAAGLERDVSRLEAEAAALRAQLKITGDLNATLRGRDQEQAQHIEEVRRRLRAVEVLESTQLLREACGLLEECCLERAAIAEELERGMGMLQADASILRAALRTQFEFLQQDREGFAREIAQGSPRRLSSPGLLGRTSASFPSPQALRPPGSSRASPRGLSPLSRASWPTGGGGAGSVPPTAATAAAALSAAAATSSVTRTCWRTRRPLNSGRWTRSPRC